MTQEIDYRYPTARLAPVDLEWVRAELAAIEARFGLFKGRPGLLEVEAIFLERCSPLSPRREALAAAARVLYLVLFFNEAMAAPRIATDAAAAWARIFDQPSSIPAAAVTAGLLPAAEETGAFVRAALPSGGSLASFAHLLRVNFAAFVYQTERHAQPTSVEEHLDVRTETISAIGYLRLWGLLCGLSAQDELRFGVHLQQTERLSARVQALANDLRSVARDRADGTPNAVLLAGEEGHVEEEAPRAVRRLHDNAVAALDAALFRARQVAAGAPSVLQQLAFIELCTRGNNEAMNALVRRYR